LTREWFLFIRRMRKGMEVALETIRIACWQRRVFFVRVRIIRLKMKVWMHAWVHVLLFDSWFIEGKSSWHFIIKATKGFVTKVLRKRIISRKMSHWR
jgi:hypothetical protein